MTVLYKTPTREIEVGVSDDCLFIWTNRYKTMRMVCVYPHKETIKPSTDTTNTSLRRLQEEMRAVIREWCEKKAEELGYRNKVVV